MIIIQCCAGCKHAKGAYGAYFCLNPDSEYHGGWIKRDYCCEDYEDMEENLIR